MKLAGKSILVTGSNGFIGLNLVKKLLDMDCVVIGFDIRSNMLIDDKDNRFIQIIGDFTKDEDLIKLSNYNMDVVFHCGGSASVPDSVKNPVLDFKRNGLGTLNLLEWSRRNNVEKFIYTSTVSIFDPSNLLPLNEKSLIRVSSPYGASKLIGESYCYTYYRTYYMNTNVVRFFNVYGPGVKHLLIYDFMNKLKSNPDILEIEGDGQQTRDYLYIDDAVNALILVAENGKPGEDYNAASGKPVKISEIAKMLIQIMDFNKTKIKYTNRFRKGDIKNWYADISKISDLGFKPNWNLKDGLCKTIKYF